MPRIPPLPNGHSIRNVSGVIGFVISLSATHLCAQEGPQSWTDSTGKRTIEATFLRMEKDQVILKKSDGKEVKIPLTKLNPTSQKQAWDTAAALKAKTNPANPKIMKDSPTSPAPKAGDLPVERIPVEEKQYVSLNPIAFPENVPAKEYVDFVISKLRQHDYIVLWDMLPTNLQKEFEEAVQLSMQKADKDVAGQVSRSKTDAISVLRQKKDFILNHPAVAEIRS